MKKKLNKKIILLFLIVLFISFVMLRGISNSEILESGTRVEPNTELIYYLDVKYDGVDKYGVSSNDDVKAEIKSNYIYVEDIIPNGLIFNGFVTTEDGSIGAYDRNSGEMCLGKVIDDTDGVELLNSYHGLHYDEESRKVYFKVSGLQAGCVLTVGIKTITPNMGDEHRKDFYNTATSQEGDYNAISNTVHAWMGVEIVPTYEVVYEFEGEIPTGVVVPESVEYSEGASVVVGEDPRAYGYDFSGWYSEDVSVANGSFIMPQKEVILKGHFTKKISYKVVYEVEGDKPDNYETPLTKEYYTGDVVKVDTLSLGSIVNGYEFLGWKDKNGNLVEKNINIENEDVNLIGEFKLKTYKLSYEFYNTILPSNSSAYLPPSIEVVPGTSVSLPIINDVEGFEFVGWYKENNFIMPEKDLIVFGEWQKKVEYFEPRIEINIDPAHDFLHKKGNEVEFEVKIFNDQGYSIKDVYVGNNLKNVELFIDENLGRVASESVVLIDEIPANSYVSYKSIYKVTEQDFGIIENEVEILSVLSDGNRELNTDKEYKAVDDLAIMSSINLCNTIINSTDTDDTIFTYNVIGHDFDQVVELGNDECEILYVDPGEYKVIQENVKNYRVAEIVEGIKHDGDTFSLKEKERINIKYVNEFLAWNPNTSNTNKMFVKFLIFIAFGALIYLLYQNKIKKESI